MTDAWSLQLSNSSRDGRYAIGALLGPLSGGPMAWRDGVLPSASIAGSIVDLRAIPAPTPDRSLRIYPGSCVISRGPEGPYVCWAATTSVITAEPADTANDRVDLLIARLYDSAIGDGKTGPWLEILTGNPSATPSAPPVPDGSIALAELVRRAGVDAIGLPEIRDRRRAAWLRGGIRLLLPGDDRAEPGAYLGEYRHRAGFLECWDGAVWRGTRALPAQYTATITERRGVTEPVSIASLTVADPGFPYQLTVSGTAEVLVSDQDGEQIPAGRADLSVRLDSATGPVLATGVGPDTTALRAVYRQPVVRLGKATTTATTRSTTLTGSRTVHLAVTGVYGDPGYRFGAAPFNGSLFVQAVAV